MSNTASNHTTVIITPALLKQQIINRLHALVGKLGSGYYPTDENGNTDLLAVIDGFEIHGVETKGKNVYLMGVPTDEDISINLEDEPVGYEANNFYIEQLWQVYLACEPIYQSRLIDYASIQD